MWLAGGITPDGLFNGSISIAVGVAGLAISPFLSYRDRKEQARKAAETELRFNELTDRMDAQREAQVKRTDAMWEDRLKDRDKQISALQADLKAARRNHG